MPGVLELRQGPLLVMPHAPPVSLVVQLAISPLSPVGHPDATANSVI